MAYIVVRNKVSGSVSLVEKRRVKNPDGTSSVRDVSIVAGLGVMSQEDFISFQTWAHGFKDQKMRKEAVLGSHAHAYHKSRVETTPAKETPVRTPKKPRKPSVRRVAKTVRKSYPVPKMAGGKGRDAGKTHTRIMMERKKDQGEEAKMRKLEKPKTEKWKPQPYFEPGMGKGGGGVPQRTLQRDEQAVKEARIAARKGE